MSHAGDEYTVFELGDSAWSKPGAVGGGGMGSEDVVEVNEAVDDVERDELAMSLELGNAQKALTTTGLVETTTALTPGVGVLRMGQVGLMASASNVLHGGGGPTPEPPPSGAKRIGGRGYEGSSDEGEKEGKLGPVGGFAKPAQGLPSPLVTFPPSERVRPRPGMSEDEVAAQDMKLYLVCRNYFIMGCLALPLLHLVNAWYFRKELIGREDIDAHPLTKQFARLSLFVALIWIGLFIGWLVTYQKTVSWHKLLGVQNTQLKHMLI